VLHLLVEFSAPTHTPEHLLTLNDRAAGWGSTCRYHHKSNASARSAPCLQTLADRLDNETASTVGASPRVHAWGRWL